MERFTKKHGDNYALDLTGIDSSSVKTFNDGYERRLTWGITRLGRYESAIEFHLNKFEIFVKKIESEDDLILAKGTFLVLRDLILIEDSIRLDSILEQKEKEILFLINQYIQERKEGK